MFKRPHAPQKKVYKPIPANRCDMSPSNYDVYLDGFPIKNPPVCVKDIPWTEYQKNPSLLDEYLKPFTVFGIAKYGPSKRFSGHDKGHIVVQFFLPETASSFLNAIRNKVCYSTILTTTLFGEINPQDQRDYGYDGSEPTMGGLSRPIEHRSVRDYTKSTKDQNFKISVDYVNKQMSEQYESSRNHKVDYDKKRGSSDPHYGHYAPRRLGRGVRNGYNGPPIRDFRDDKATRIRDGRSSRLNHDSQRRKNDRQKEVTDARTKPSSDELKNESVPDNSQKKPHTVQHVFTAETPKKSGTPLNRQVNERPKDILQTMQDFCENGAHEDFPMVDNDEEELPDTENDSDPAQFGDFEHSPEKITEEVPISDADH